MKVLTVIEPWATLIVHGFKAVETRPAGITWKNYRGTVLIHVSKTFTKFTNDLCWEYPFQGYLKNIGLAPPLIFKFGYIIGQVDIYDCKPVEEIEPQATAEEVFMGDYSPGRLGLLLRNPMVFDKPIPAKGNQGLWNFDMEESK